jgi:hypothetical protein
VTDCAYVPPPRHTPDEVRAKIRDDLIRRLFAVAISVGAATTLARMGWVEHGRWPRMDEWQQLFVLAAALWATVLSWDGYLFSISTRPLRKTSRFVIDILLVFIYMFLLMTSKLLIWWVFLHALIYALYVVWDWLSVRDWPRTYSNHPDVGPAPTVGEVYIGGFQGSPDVKPGPIITIVWAGYFWALYLLNDRALHWLGVPGLDERIIGTTIVVVLGLYFYRRDKAKPFTMRKRVAHVAMLLIISAAYLAWLPTDSTVWNWGWVGPYIGSASSVQ